jgi:hypothetical protein
MTRTYVEDSLDDDAIPLPVTLADGHIWSEAVFNDMENANWHDPLEAFTQLIHILPQIHETLELFGYHKLARKLQKSVDKWDNYF